MMFDENKVGAVEQTAKYESLPHQAGSPIELEYVDIMFAGKVTIDTSTGEILPSTLKMSYEKRNTPPYTMLSKYELGEVFYPTFAQNYESYKSRFLARNPEYVSYLEHTAAEVISKKNLKEKQPRVFVCIPSRNEKNTSQAVQLALESLQTSAICLVNHNFIEQPDQQVDQDMNVVKERVDTFVVEGFAKNNMGDARGLISDLSLEISYQLGIEDPILVSLDADLRALEEKNSIQALVQPIIDNQEVMITSGHQFYDLPTIQDAPRMRLFFELLNRVTKAQQITSQHRTTQGNCTAIRGSAYAHVSGYLRVAVGEDIVLGKRIGSVFSENGLVFPKNAGVIIDGSRSGEVVENRYSQPASFFAISNGTERKITDIDKDTFIKKWNGELADLAYKVLYAPESVISTALKSEYLSIFADYGLDPHDFYPVIKGQKVPETKHKLRTILNPIFKAVREFFNH